MIFLYICAYTIIINSMRYGILSNVPLFLILLISNNFMHVANLFYLGACIAPTELRILLSVFLSETFQMGQLYRQSHQS